MVLSCYPFALRRLGMRAIGEGKDARDNYEQPPHVHFDQHSWNIRQGRNLAKPLKLKQAMPTG